MSVYLMEYNLIMPSNAETSITGFAMGAEKKIGKSLWRLEIHNGERFCRVYKDGKQQASVSICGPSVIKFSNALVAKYNSLMQIS